MLFGNQLTSKKEVITDAPFDGLGKPFEAIQTKIRDVTESITQSKITFEVPGKVMHQEVVEVKGNVIYQAVYKDKDGQLISRRWIVNTDKDGKNPTLHKFGKTEIVQDLGQFNLQVISGNKPKPAPVGVR